MEAELLGGNDEHDGFGNGLTLPGIDCLSWAVLASLSEPESESFEDDVDEVA